MAKFLLRRLFQIIPVLLIISFIVFSLVFIAGDPVALMLPDDASQEDVEQLREALGLNEHFIVQYGIYNFKEESHRSNTNDGTNAYGKISFNIHFEPRKRV